jgi:hypothetical protein
VQNIGNEFVLKLYSQYNDCIDFYRFQKTQNGWKVTTPERGIVESGKNGMDGIRMSLEHVLMSYPVDLGGYLYSIWELSQEENTIKVQESFDELGAWLSTNEINKPKFFKAYD